MRTHDLFDEDKNEDNKELPTPLCAHMTSSTVSTVAPPCKCIQSKVVVQPKNIKSIYKNKAENMSLLLKRYNRSDI